MFELCLFDLDQTLVETDDLKDVREAGRQRTDQAYVQELKQQVGKAGERLYYSQTLLAKIRRENPGMKLGVFTRSPRTYATTIMSSAYPKINWDDLVAFGDVKRTKPYGDGIHAAMSSCGVKDPARVVLVGDGDNDIRAAYNAGCVAVLDKRSWGRKYVSDNWNAMGHIPDAIIESPDDLPDVLKDYRVHLPELERLLSGTNERPVLMRFDKINKFIPKGIGGDSTPFPIHLCGRSFSNYQSLERRKQWHALSQSIVANKESDIFPNEWITAVRSFIQMESRAMLLGNKTMIVSVIPHRPGRKPRLEKFVQQLEASHKKSPISTKVKLIFTPDLLAYKDGVHSHSKEKLGQLERFANVRDYLFVNRTDGPKTASILVLDDVCTTGASLIYAKKHLNDAGFRDVTCLTVAMNVGNVLYD